MSVSTAPPQTKEWLLYERDGAEVPVVARQLGHGTSDDGTKPRWTEVEIYRDTEGVFYVQIVGATQVENEEPRYTLHRTSSAFEVIEVLTAHLPTRSYLPRQSARALAQAAQWDNDMRDAYINRAVM